MNIPGTMNAAVYVDRVIKNILTNFHGSICDNFLFVDDNAPQHRANIVDEALENHGIPPFGNSLFVR